MRTNAFREEAVADYKVKQYKNTLQDCWRNSKPDWSFARALHSL